MMEYETTLAPEPGSEPAASAVDGEGAAAAPVAAVAAAAAAASGAGGAPPHDE